MNTNIKYHKLTANKHYFTVTNATGKTILQSNTYTRKHDAKRGAESFIKAVQNDQFLTYFNKKRCYFSVVNRHGKDLAKSKLWSRRSDLSRTINKLKEVWKH